MQTISRMSKIYRAGLARHSRHPIAASWRAENQWQGWRPCLLVEGRNTSALRVLKYAGTHSLLIQIRQNEGCIPCWHYVDLPYPPGIHTLPSPRLPKVSACTAPGREMPRSSYCHSWHYKSLEACPQMVHMPKIFRNTSRVPDWFCSARYMSRLIKLPAAEDTSGTTLLVSWPSVSAMGPRRVARTSKTPSSGLSRVPAPGFEDDVGPPLGAAALSKPNREPASTSVSEAVAGRPCGG